MSVPLPTPLEQLGSRRFSFYPPILGIEHNQWTFRRVTASEIQVVNTRTQDELSIPRRFIGEVSTIGEPVVIVGLVKELELRQGVVYPHVRRVIEMPRAVNDSPRLASPRAPAAVIGIRVEPDRSLSWRARWLPATVAAAVLACVAVVSFSAHVALPFTAHDDYDSIVARIGPPANEATEMKGAKQYRRLQYPRRNLTLLLIDGHYAGAVDSAGRVLQVVRPLNATR
jgi:hypothetical protein